MVKRRRITRASIIRGIPTVRPKRYRPVTSKKSCTPGRGRITGAYVGKKFYDPARDLTIKGLKSGKAKFKTRGKTYIYVKK